MSLLKKFVDVFKSNVNDALDKAEDPEKMLPMLIGEMEEQFKNVKVQVAQSIADQKRLEQQYQANAAQSEEWDKKAKLAVEKGDDVLAKEALTRKKSYGDIAGDFKKQNDEQTQIVEKLKVQLSQLEGKLEEARRKKNVLMARARRADALKNINENLSKATETGAFDTFSRMEDKVGEKEAFATAVEELGKDDLQTKFETLEKGSNEAIVNDELAALKAQVAKDKGTTS